MKRAKHDDLVRLIATPEGQASAYAALQGRAAPEAAAAERFLEWSQAADRAQADLRTLAKKC